MAQGDQLCETNQSSFPAHLFTPSKYRALGVRPINNASISSEYTKLRFFICRKNNVTMDYGGYYFLREGNVCFFRLAGGGGGGGRTQGLENRYFHGELINRPFFKKSG
jgi:hypothetical protein